MATIKTIDAAIRRIKTNAGKLDTLVLQTAAQIVGHGVATRHFDRAAVLVGALEGHKRLQKEVLTFFRGKIPHTIIHRGDAWTIGQRNESLLHTAAELAAADAERAEKRAALSAAAAEKREANKKTLAEAEGLQAVIKELRAKIGEQRDEIEALKGVIGKLDEVIVQLERDLAQARAHTGELTAVEAELREEFAEVA